MRLHSAGGSTGLKVQNGFSHMAGSWCWLAAGASQFSRWPPMFQEAIRASVFHGSPGAVFLEGENKFEGLLKPTL